MQYSPILAPVVALVAWSLVMLVWLAIARRRAFAQMGIGWGTIPRGARGANLDSTSHMTGGTSAFMIDRPSVSAS